MEPKPIFKAVGSVFFVFLDTGSGQIPNLGVRLLGKQTFSERLNDPLSGILRFIFTDKADFYIRRTKNSLQVRFFLV